jgi:plasmid stabilization system protein ParE
VKRAHFLEQGETDFVEIVASLDDARSGLGDRFADEVERALLDLGDYPLSGPAISARARKKRLHSLPYNLLYTIHDDEILVLGIVHHSRGSREIRRRLRALRDVK